LIVLVDCHFIKKVIGVFYPSTAPLLPCLRNTTKCFQADCCFLVIAHLCRWPWWCPPTTPLISTPLRKRMKQILRLSLP
jgi:hypothetical protein